MLNRKTTLILACLVAAVLAAAPTVFAADHHVYPGDSIQDAIDAALDGDTVYVHEGTYQEALEIDGADVTLVAVGSVTLAPSTCTSHDDVITIYDAAVTIAGFEVDATNCYSGIYARAASWLAEQPVDVKLQDNFVHDYFKNGITVNCDLATGSVKNNRVEGSGPSGDVAQNGIQFGYGATGEIMQNTVISHWYTGANWMSSGILVFESNDVTVQRNAIYSSQTGVAVEAWCYFQPSASDNRVVANDIQDAEWGVSVAAWDLPWSNCDASANNNKVVHNVVTATDGETGVSIWAGYDEYYGDEDWSPTADNNKVLRNVISGYTYPISDVGTSSKVHANTPLH